MKRWAWNLFCAVSLMVFATSVGLFVFSWFAVGQMTKNTQELPDPGTNPTWYGHFEYLALCSQGEVHFARLRYDAGVTGVGGASGTSIYKPARTLLGSRGPYSTFYYSLPGFRMGNYLRKFSIVTLQEYFITLPLCLFFLAAIPPWLWWRRWRSSQYRRGFPITPTPAPAPPTPITQPSEPT